MLAEAVVRRALCRSTYAMYAAGSTTGATASRARGRVPFAPEEEPHGIDIDRRDIAIELWSPMVIAAT